MNIPFESDLPHDSSTKLHLINVGMRQGGVHLIHRNGSLPIKGVTIFFRYLWNCGLEITSTTAEMLDMLAHEN